MRNYKKNLLWATTALLVLSFVLWAYYVSINLKHVYTLLDCSKGQVALIPKHLCQTYLFTYGGTQDDVAQINHDGSLLAIVSAASKEDQSRLIEFLLEKGVDINGLDDRAGISPLHAAVLDNASEIIEMFLHHGANPLIKDKKRGLTPLEFALQLKGKPGQPDRTAIIKLLEHATKS